MAKIREMVALACIVLSGSGGNFHVKTGGMSLRKVLSAFLLLNLIFLLHACGGGGGGSSSSSTSEPQPGDMKSFGSFSLDYYEVTQSQFQTAMGFNPSNFSGCGGNCPVESVSWYEAENYCKAVGKRLPTDDEWRHAASNGGSSVYVTGSSTIPTACGGGGNGANYVDCLGRTSPVGSYGSTANGLYDMGGNVWEWNSDDYGSKKSMRGGSWNYDLQMLLTSTRSSATPSWAFNYVGFRCAR